MENDINVILPDLQDDSVLKQLYKQKHASIIVDTISL